MLVAEIECKVGGLGGEGGNEDAWQKPFRTGMVPHPPVTEATTTTRISTRHNKGTFRCKENLQTKPKGAKGALVQRTVDDPVATLSKITQGLTLGREDKGNEYQTPDGSTTASPAKNNTNKQPQPP